jgi:hypothetical protein
MTKSSTFVSFKERYKYKYLQRIRQYVQNTIGFIQNHRLYEPIRNNVVDYLGTSILCMIAVLGFYKGTVVTMGFSVAMILYLLQHYIRWFYDTRKRYKW